MELGVQEDPDKLIEPNEEDEMAEMKGQLGEKLSYAKVQAHIYANHPRDREEKTKFDWYNVNISYLPLFASKIKKTEWVTPCAKEIGLGPTLFLMTMKAFFFLFAFFAIINIPLFFFYLRGAGPQGASTGGNFVTMFGAMSLGNIGTSSYTCATLNMA
jgi:hypothetical protein